jgi:hypothetical protein
MAATTSKLTKKVSSTPRSAGSAKALAAKPAARPRTLKAAPVSTSPASKKRPVAAVKARPTIAAATVKRTVVAKKAAIKTVPVAEKKVGTLKPGKVKKPKLVRDSFTMPKEEYAVIASLKARCLQTGVSVKKSEILRAAIANLAKLSDTSLSGAIRRLDVIKTGRPAKGSK